MLNPSRNPNIALVPKGGATASPGQGATSPDARTAASRGIDLSLPAVIVGELEPAVARAGFRLEIKDTNPIGQDNIRFTRICGRSKSGPSSAALFYVDGERLQLQACTEPYFVYSLCVRVCKKFRSGDADTLSLVVLTPEGTSCPRTWEQQIRDFKDIRAVAAAECLSTPPPEQWSNAGVDVAMQYVDEWTRPLGLNPLEEAAGTSGPSTPRTMTASAFDGASLGEAPDSKAPHVFISHAPADREHQVYISYAWGGESERVVNELDADLRAKGIVVVRDKRDLGYKGMIRDFMQEIGRGHAVVVVISDKYLKSPNCMFELVEIVRNKDVRDRIFPVVLQDADIYNPVNRIRYIKHWEDRLKELDEAMHSVSATNLQGMREEIDAYDAIRDHVSRLTSMLKDMNTLTLETHEKSDFAMLISGLEKRLNNAAAPSVAAPAAAAARVQQPDRELFK